MPSSGARSAVRSRIKSALHGAQAAELDARDAITDAVKGGCDEQELAGLRQALALASNRVHELRTRLRLAKS